MLELQYQQLARWSIMQHTGPDGAGRTHVWVYGGEPKRPETR